MLSAAALVKNSRREILPVQKSVAKQSNCDTRHHLPRNVCLHLPRDRTVLHELRRFSCRPGAEEAGARLREGMTSVRQKNAAGRFVLSGPRRA